ncbi:Glycosyltransferase family 2 [uncultured virus]|nr:Glycosyltransferase family 2 [uncultured virus]
MLMVIIMVKNEEGNIAATLDSYREGGITKFLLYDTGSTDQTITKFREFIDQHHLEGKIYELPFTNFATSRNAGLAKLPELFPECRFAFMPDAEWYIENAKGLVEYCRQQKDNPADVYDVSLKGTTMSFAVRRLFRIGGSAKFRGGVHEIPIGGIYGGTIPDVYISYRSSHTGLEASKRRWYRDLGILLQEVMLTHDPRDVFYLAQTYECLGQHPEAARYYIERGNMADGFDEERFMAWYRCGKIYDLMGKWKHAHEAYLKAYELRPSRIEPLVKLAQHYPNPQIKYMYAKQACLAPKPAGDLLFVEDPLYEYDRWEQLGIGAYYMNTLAHWIEAIEADDLALKARPNTPHIVNNRKLTVAKIKESGQLTATQLELLTEKKSLITPKKEPAKEIKLTVQPLKILNLILYSEEPEYQAMADVLRRYLKAKGIPHFFYCYSESLEVDQMFQGDILYLKGKETYIPGILEKTLKIFEIFQDKDYDYIIRSNVSTVVNFQLLEHYLQDQKVDYGGPLYYTGSWPDSKSGCASGITPEKHLKYGHCHFVSGACIVLSKKAVKILVASQADMRKYEIIDDVSIGILLYGKDLIRKKIGIDMMSMDNTTFMPGKIAYRNKSESRDDDVKNMKTVVDGLLG